MQYANRRTVGGVPLFDPEDGVTVVEPPGSGRGHWAGGCSALYDEVREKFYLCYRVRTPADRGGLCCVAESQDGRAFKIVWQATRGQFGSQSIEKSSLFARQMGGSGSMSYVDARTYKWRIDLLEADQPEGFEPTERVLILDGDMCDNQGVKDPVIFLCGGIYYLFVNYAPAPCWARPGESESDACGGKRIRIWGGKYGTGLATSVDGMHFSWQGSVLEPGTGWDAFMVRMGTVIYTPPVFTAFYDGRPNVAASYEDKCGVAVSFDLRHFDKVSLDEPVLQSVHATGCLRYLSAVPVGDQCYYYYEYTRSDGSHELRLNVVDVN